MIKQVYLLFAKAVQAGKAVAVKNEKDEVTFIPMQAFRGKVEDTLSLTQVAKDFNWDANWQEQVDKMDVEL